MLIRNIIRLLATVILPLAPVIVEQQLSPATSRSIAMWRDLAIARFHQRYLAPPRLRRRRRRRFDNLSAPFRLDKSNITWGVCLNPAYISRSPTRPLTFFLPPPPNPAVPLSITRAVASFSPHPTSPAELICPLPLLTPTSSLAVLASSLLPSLSPSRAVSTPTTEGGTGPAHANNMAELGWWVLRVLVAMLFLYMCRSAWRRGVSSGGAVAETPRLVVVRNLDELAESFGVGVALGSLAAPPPPGVLNAAEDSLVPTSPPALALPSSTETAAVTGEAAPTPSSNPPATSSALKIRAADTPAAASTPSRLQSGERAETLVPVPVITDPVGVGASSPQVLPTTPSPQAPPTTPAALVYPSYHPRRKTVPRVWPSSSPCSGALLADMPPYSPKTASTNWPREPISPLRFEMVVVDEPTVSVSSGSAPAAPATDVSPARAPRTPPPPFASPSHPSTVTPSPTVASAALLLFPATSPADAGLPVALAESESSLVDTLTAAFSSMSIGVPSPSKRSPRADTLSLSMSVSDLEPLPAVKLELLPAAKPEVVEAGAEDKDAEAGTEDEDAVRPVRILGDRGMREGKRHGKPGAASAAETSFLARWEGQTLALGRSVAAPKPLAKTDGREAEAEEPEAVEQVVEEPVAEAVEQVVEAAVEAVAELQVDAGMQAEELAAAAGPSVRLCTPASGGEGAGARKAETATRPGSRLHRGPSFIPLASQVNGSASDVQRQRERTTSVVASKAKPQVANGAGPRGAQGQRESASASKMKPQVAAPHNMSADVVGSRDAQEQRRRQCTQSASASTGGPRAEGVRKENAPPASTAAKGKDKAPRVMPRWQ